MCPVCADSIGLPFPSYVKGALRAKSARRQLIKFRFLWSVEALCRQCGATWWVKPTATGALPVDWWRCRSGCSGAAPSTGSQTTSVLPYHVRRRPRSGSSADDQSGSRDELLTHRHYSTPVNRRTRSLTLLLDSFGSCGACASPGLRPLPSGLRYVGDAQEKVSVVAPSHGRSLGHLTNRSPSHRPQCARVHHRREEDLKS